MATFIEDLGIVSAYGEAVRKGYTGTEEEFAEMLANLPDKLAEAREYAASAAKSSASAASSADGVQRNASIASTAASDAQSAAASALQSATFAETTVEGIEEHEEQCRIYRAEAVAAAEELKTTTLWNDALIDETVTGKIASFDDGCAGMPMKSIVAEIIPVQEGTGDPSPTNIRPISGRTGLTVTAAGKNLLPKYVISPSVYNNVTFTVNDDGSVSAVGTASATCNAGNVISGIGGEYILSGCPSGGGASTYQLWVFDQTVGAAVGAADTGNGATVTLDKTHTYNVRIRVQSGYTINKVFYPMLRPATITDDTYEPYTAQTIPITWQTEAGTVYGGTLDVVSGVLTVDKILRQCDADSNFGKGGSTSIHEYYLRNASGAETGIGGVWYDTEHIICSHAANYSELSTTGIGTRLSGGQARIYFPLSSDLNTLALFKTWLGEQATAGTPLQFCYKLATPQTYQLTPTEVRTILGENLVYSDADDVTVNYYVDMKGYIDKRLNTTRMMIAGVETSFVATKNYAIGDFVIVNDTLYRITAVITSGETITPGTNASETTVAEQLIALYNA